MHLLYFVLRLDLGNNINGVVFRVQCSRDSLEGGRLDKVDGVCSWWVVVAVGFG